MEARARTRPDPNGFLLEIRNGCRALKQVKSQSKLLRADWLLLSFVVHRPYARKCLESFDETEIGIPSLEQTMAMVKSYFC